MALQFVIDNSVVMAWCFEDEASEYAQSVLASLQEAKALAPAIWPLEVGNVLLVAKRKKRLNEASQSRFLSLLRALPIQVVQESPERMLGEILALAQEYQLSTYDASYLDLAMRLGLPLATADAALKGAAKRAGVALFAP
ncbi:MAG: DNA-binding protein [Candidatus Lambdaproteobacteria bacterium RIFOXYD1_FULL_56_27]|uniref:DNA-binding protein n=1 Tax=Candidatus Lambdaproteobacteria bacterium RIFOXYD2_FULL_56_26 TaxID=1817773 RepID=A0A1F6H1T2_9PROT|nr:MAG: DNA-binding protein [Candidatus Lambdaproteobacteria bacterium RIFOXYD2_FULL_56_26]OGH05701.1 MAG: DNA-binding protein [Candidatus Lambdaproteobacteria bacterium RIFOXYC1_FULL_56_13]OGH08432.1 MAG: DNA-binding protein [Candidatus Lambdaproteobacteria bacterium RIFOXYD1_FULL_56_27]